MMKHREVEDSLKFARNQKLRAESDLHASEFGSDRYDEARTRRNLWTGYICAYELVLQIEPEQPV